MNLTGPCTMDISHITGHSVKDAVSRACLELLGAASGRGRMRSANHRCNKNSSGDEIANVNFFYSIAHVDASAYAH